MNLRASADGVYLHVTHMVLKWGSGSDCKRRPFNNWDIQAIVLHALKECAVRIFEEFIAEILASITLELDLSLVWGEDLIVSR